MLAAEASTASNEAMTERAHLRLDVELVRRGLAESRSQARAAIEAGKVSVGGAIVIEAEKAHPWVSRGGIKLEHALNHLMSILRGFPASTSERRLEVSPRFY